MLARAYASGDAQKLEEAMAFGREAGLVVNDAPAPREAPCNAPEVVPEPGPTSTPEAPAAPPQPPPPELFMGQPAERVAMYAGALLPGVETLADVARALGVDVTTPRKRTLFRDTPIEREIAADPVARMTELLAVEASERFAPKDGPGDTKADRRVELLILGGATFGPALLRFVPSVSKLPGKLVSGLKAAVGLFRRRR
jgi:hypothetical protein